MLSGICSGEERGTIRIYNFYGILIILPTALKQDKNEHSTFILTLVLRSQFYVKWHFLQITEKKSTRSNLIKISVDHNLVCHVSRKHKKIFKISLIYKLKIPPISEESLDLCKKILSGIFKTCMSIFKSFQ